MPNLLTKSILRLQKFIAGQPLARRVADRYPRFAKVISRRFDTTTFSGLTLTILLLVFISATVLLAEIAEDVSESDSIVQMDQAFSTFLFHNRSLVLSRFLYIITQFGSLYGCIAICVVYSVIMLYRKRRVYILALWSIILGMGVSIHFTKIVFHRARPVDIAYYIEDHFSFPSGHSASAMLLYGFIAYTFIRLGHGGGRSFGFIAACLLILLVGFSRVYLGVHFLSDVLCGYLVGVIWMVLGISLVEWQESRKRVVLGNTEKPDSE
jgi:undecaprenyl-diphosphatase